MGNTVTPDNLLKMLFKNSCRAGLEMGRYGPVWHTRLPRPPGKHTSTSFLKKDILVWHALQTILWDLGNWSLMFASISGQNSARLRDEGKEGKATIPAFIFSHFEPCCRLKAKASKDTLLAVLRQWQRRSIAHVTNVFTRESHGRLVCRTFRESNTSLFALPN